jgi:hypothetical protein
VINSLSASWRASPASRSVGSSTAISSLEHRLGNRTREVQAWDGAGQVNAKRGDLTAAIDLHASAAEVFRSHHAAWLQATALAHLAFARKAAGDTAHASGTARRAAEMLDDFTDPDAETLKAVLRDLYAESV